MSKQVLCKNVNKFVVTTVYIEKKSALEFIKTIDKFGWGFPLLDDAWNGQNFSKYDIMVNYPKEWDWNIGKLKVFKGNESIDYDVYVSDS